LTEPRGSNLIAEAVTFGFPQRPDFLKPVRLEMSGGQCWGIIGPNGAGKSTVLRLLAGLLTPTSGRVLLDGRSLTQMALSQRGRRIAFMPQKLAVDIPMAAGDIVAMGRYPHRRLGLFEDAGDREIVDRAMERTESLAFAERPMDTLSGGEVQRVHIAAAIAQEPSILLLDEPTAALDLHHQLRIFEIIRALSEQDGLLLVVVTHDINLAARYCSHVLLLHEGRTVASGPPEAVMDRGVLETVYGVELVAMHHAGDDRPWMQPLRPLGGDA